MAKVEGSNPSESTKYKGFMAVAGQNLKDQIRKLVELQVMDEEIFRFKRELREKPIEVENLKKEFESKNLKQKYCSQDCARKSNIKLATIKQQELIKVDSEYWS